MTDNLERRDLVDKADAWDAIAAKNAEITRLQEALAAAEARAASLREGLRVADEWLSGWASAEPYHTAIQQVLASSSERCKGPVQVGLHSPAPVTQKDKA